MKQTTFYLLIAFFSLGIISARAQSAYSMHTIEAGESLSNLAKSHHTTVGDIMRLNGMNAQSQLHVGDKIKIPASATTVQAKPAASAPASVASPATTTAKTHVVTTGETLYRISQMYKIPVEKLMAMNNLPDGNLKLGQTLVVSEGIVPQSSAVIKPEPTTTASSEPKKQSTQVEAAPVPQQPKQSASGSVTTTPAASQKPVTTPASTTPPVIDVDNSSEATLYSSVTDIPKEGFFTALYGKEVKSNRSEKTKNGASMTFKSASGWADKKYYILMDDVPSGSIVKIKSGNSELYAKVLWNLGDMKENEGLDFRISTATAAALGISDQKFPLTVVYYN